MTEAASVQSIDTIRLSIEAVISLGATLFLASVGAAWALLHALVFKPLNKVTEELSKMSSGLQEVSAKQLAAQLTLEAELSIERMRLDKLEDHVKTLRVHGAVIQGE